MATPILFTYSARNIITGILTLCSAIIIFAVGRTLKGRDCVKSALPANWESDPTYQHPYKEDTVHYGFTFIFAILLIVLNALKCPLSSYSSRYLSWTDWWPYSLVSLMFYICGAGLSNGIVDNLKLQLCALRPFAAVRPQDKDSYLSTPSGHANMVVFTAIYVTYWLNKELLDNVLRVGCCMVMSIYPFIVCGTRITDNHHWPVDVIAGSIIGVTVAIGLFVIVESLDQKKNFPDSKEPMLVNEGGQDNSSRYS